VSSGSKTTGNYQLPVTYSRTFGTFKLALSIPQLRVINGYSLGFRQSAATPSSTGFTHVLDITDTTTSIYYMQARYIVFNTLILTKEFQTYSLVNKAETTAGKIGDTTTPTARTSVFTATLAPAAVLADKPNCMAFLTGITATSTDNYQVNITCAITTTATADISVTVYPTTIVQLISF
jgi:hypothetical protein